MNDNKGGNSGFLLGLIIGAAAVFLLGTDKGRTILKSLTDEGLSELSDILEEVEEDATEQVEQEEPAPRVKKVRAAQASTSNGHVTSSPVKRRFFRRARS